MSLDCIIEIERSLKKIPLDDDQDNIITNMELTGYIKMSLLLNI